MKSEIELEIYLFQEREVPDKTKSREYGTKWIMVV